MAKYKEILYGTVFPDSNLTGFPKLIKITTDADIAAELSGGGGIELYLADGTTPVPFGLYPTSSPAAGTLLMRVKMDPLTAASTGDTMLRLRYGSGLTTVEDKSDVVSNGYVLYMPLEEDPSGSAPQMFDWVTETNKGTANNMESGDLTAGTVGNGLLFGGTNEDVVMASSVTSAMNSATAGTIEAIVNRTSTTQIMSFGYMNQSTNRFGFGVYSDNILYFVDGAFNTVKTSFGTGTKAVACRYVGGSARTIYVNGAVASGVETNISSALNASLETCRINNWIGIGYGTGLFDECRISSVARSADWIEYQYKDDFDNANTFSLGSEQTESGAAEPVDAMGMLGFCGVGG